MDEIQRKLLQDLIKQGQSLFATPKISPKVLETTVHIQFKMQAVNEFDGDTRIAPTKDFIRKGKENLLFITDRPELHKAQNGKEFTEIAFGNFILTSYLVDSGFIIDIEGCKPHIFSRDAVRGLVDVARIEGILYLFDHMEFEVYEPMIETAPLGKEQMSLLDDRLRSCPWITKTSIVNGLVNGNDTTVFYFDSEEKMDWEEVSSDIAMLEKFTQSLCEERATCFLNVSNRSLPEFKSVEKAIDRIRNSLNN